MEHNGPDTDTVLAETAVLNWRNSEDPINLACLKKNFIWIKAKLQYNYKPENQSKLLELQQMHLSMATLL